MRFRQLTTRWLIVLWIMTLAGVLVAGEADPVAPDQSIARPIVSARQHLAVATYNVQNLLDVFDDPYSLDEKSPVKPAEAIERIAAAIRETDADIVALQEVEHEGLLRAVVHDQLGDLGYEYIVVEPTNSYFGANLGVISRLPILSITSHRKLDLQLENETRVWRFSRDLLCVRIQVTANQTLDLFVTHFKNGDDPRSAKWREAEAAATRRIVLGTLHAHPGCWVLLAGDLNDRPQSVTLATLLQPCGVGDPLIQGITDGSPQTRQTEMDTDAIPEDVTVAVAALVDLHAGLDAARRVTRLDPQTGSNGPVWPRRGTVDFLLAGQDLAQCVVKGSAEVVNPEGLPHGSDHVPLVARFVIDTIK